MTGYSKVLSIAVSLWLCSTGHAQSNPDDIKAAGCLITTRDGFVIVQNRLLDRLQLPIGRHEPGESARQTAARETLEETGLEVETDDIAFKVGDQKVFVYFCRPKSGTVDSDKLVARDQVEVSRVMIVNPITLQTPEGEKITTPWRFPQTHWLLSALWPMVQ